MRYWLALLLLAFSPTTLYAPDIDKPAVIITIDEIMLSTCMISTERGSGTGFVIAQDNEYFWIMTAGHVAQKKGNLRCIFYSNGHQSHYMHATTIWVIYKEKTLSDLALIKLPKSEFGDYPTPKPLCLAKANHSINIDEVVVSAGCETGRWPSGWRGNILEVNEDCIKVRPATPSGRSGSPVVNSTGKVIGMVIWQDGTALGPAMFYKLLKWNSLSPTEE